MEEYLLRIAVINLNENLVLLNTLNRIQKCNVVENKELEDGDSFFKLKQYYLEIAEELESHDIIIRFNSLTKLLLSFIKNHEFIFMLNDKLEENFNKIWIEKAFEYGILNDLVKNLGYFYAKFIELSK
jgi:hypothetical protein